MVKVYVEYMSKLGLNGRSEGVEWLARVATIIHSPPAVLSGVVDKI